MLGDQGPSTADPSKYIRFIYNRVILENATIRASAVCALAKFGQNCPQLRPSILVLLRRCLYDNDDEVRDRAAFFVSALRELGRDGDEDSTTSPVLAKFDTPLGALETSLRAYVADERFESQAFDLGAVDHTGRRRRRPSASAAAAARSMARRRRRA